jgi:DNA-binding transcriptional ArsR family regulator
MSRPYATESVFRAIADPTRRRIIELLLVSDRSGAELVQSLNISQPTLSHHLSILRETGLVTNHRVGRNRMYQIHANLLKGAADWLRKCRA